MKMKGRHNKFRVLYKKLVGQILKKRDYTNMDLQMLCLKIQGVTICNIRIFSKYFRNGFDDFNKILIVH